MNYVCFGYHLVNKQWGKYTFIPDSKEECNFNINFHNNPVVICTHYNELQTAYYVNYQINTVSTSKFKFYCKDACSIYWVAINK